MMMYDKIKLYVPVKNGITFPSNDPEKHQFIYLSENINFETCYNFLNINKLYTRSIYLHRYKKTGIKIWPMASDALQLRKKLQIKYSSINSNFIIQKNENFYCDFDNILNHIIEYFNHNLKQTKLYNYIFELFETNKQNFSFYNKVLLYTIDLKSYFEPIFARRKLYIIFFILYLHHQQKIKDLPFNDLLFGLITEEGIRYILLVKNKVYNMSRILAYFKNIKLVADNDETELSTIIVDYIHKQDHTMFQDNQEPTKNNDIIDDRKKKTQKLIDVHLKKMPHEEVQQLKTKFNDAIQKDDVKTFDKLSKKLIVKSIILSTTNNHELSQTTQKEIDDTDNKIKHNAIISKTIKTYGKLSLDKQLSDITIQPKNNQVVNHIDNTIINDNKVPVKIIEKRNNDFNKNLYNDIKNIFLLLEKKDIPLKLISLKIMDDVALNGELEHSDKTIIDVKMQDPKTKKIFENKIVIPKMFDDNYFFINGRKKIIINQLVLLPIMFLKKYKCRIQTNYAVVSIEQITYKGNSIFSTYIGGMTINIPYVMFAYFGLKRTMNELDIPYKVFNKKDIDAKNNKEYNLIKIHDDHYLGFKNINDDWKNIFINSIQYQKISKYPDDFDDKLYFSKLLNNLTGNLNSNYVLTQILDNIIEPISTEILKAKGLPILIIDIFKYIIKKLPTGYFERTTDISKMYLRTSDIISHYLLKEVLTAYGHYRAYNLASGSGDFKLDYDYIYSNLQTSGVVQNAEYINPLEELSYITRVTQSGYGNPTNDAININKRSVDPSMFGNISTVDTPEGGNIGVIQHLTVNSELINKRGIFGIKQLNDKEKSGILSVSEVMTPFIDRNEPTRMIMATAQAKQAIPVKLSQIPAVMTGYEPMLTGLLSESFIKKSKIDGKVIYADYDKIVIEGKNSKDTILIKKINKLKSGQGVNINSYFTPTVKKGDKVLKNQIVATGQGIKDGAIASGVNLLTAFMPYKGYTFEDGIVVSEDVFNSGKLESQHVFEVECIIKLGDKIIDLFDNYEQLTKPGDVILKYIPKDLSSVYDKIEQTDSYDYFNNTVFIRSPGGKLRNIFIAPNHTPLVHEKINKIYMKQQRKAPIGTWTIKNEKIDGIYIKFQFVKDVNIQIGDKLTNRHGAKGTIALIEKAENMPMTPWGERIELIANSISILNRINFGQLFEIYTGLISKKVYMMLLKNGIDKITENKQLVKKIYILLDNTENRKISNQMSNYIDKMSKSEYNDFYKTIINNKYLPIIIPPFQSPNIKQLESVMELLDIDIEGVKLYYPEFNFKSPNKVSIGLVYILKLEHMAYKKIKSRSTGSYSAKTGQPTQSKEIATQRAGEFDSWSLLSWDADAVFRELYGPSADDTSSKQEMIRNIINDGNTQLVNSKKSKTKDLLINYFKIVGLDVS